MADERSSPDSYITRREADQMRADLRDTRAWLERIDTQGTRSSSVTEARVVDLGGDIRELKAELRSHLADHKRTVEAAEARAQAALDAAGVTRAEHRKWVIATAFGALGVVAGWAGVLYEVMHSRGH